MEFAGFHVVNITVNPPMGSKQNAEIYYVSDLPFPFTHASDMIREQNMDTEVAFLQEVQNQDCAWENIKKTLQH